MLSPPRPTMQDIATSRVPCMAADISLPKHSPCCKLQYQNTAVRRARSAEWSLGNRLMCRAEIAEADVGPSTSSGSAAVVDFESEASTAAVPTSDTWELDFSSRPILDSRGKKRWELLMCSPDRSWVYSKWFPNNKINSTQVHYKSDPPVLLSVCYPFTETRPPLSTQRQCPTGIVPSYWL